MQVFCNLLLQSACDLYRGHQYIMEYTDLTLAQDKGVLTITVDRPEVLNAQSRIMREIIFRPAMSLVAPRR